VLDDDILEQLRAQAKQPRKHAPFFARRDRSAAGKGIAEAGVVGSLLEGMAAVGVCRVSRSSSFR
jgi:hypothetical protein